MTSLPFIDSEFIFQNISDPFKAVIPEVEGTAFVTGTHRFLIDPEDPLKNGFILR